MNIERIVEKWRLLKGDREISRPIARETGSNTASPSVDARLVGARLTGDPGLTKCHSTRKVGRTPGFVLLVGLSFAFTLALGAPPDESGDDGSKLVEQFVADVRTMSGRFEQSLVDSNDEITETSSGTFEILRPGRFRWSYTEPYEQVLVADGTNVWSYDVDLEQVTVKPQAEVLGSTPASLLGGSADVLDNFEAKGRFEDRGTVWVRLEPKGGDTSFEMVELGFTDGVLSRMILSDDLEQTTLVALHDVEVNEEIDPEHFEFTPPDDVDLVGQPSVSDTSGR